MSIPSLALAVSLAIPALSATATDAVRFTLRDGGAVVVPVHLDGRGPHPFLLDTGAAGSAVSGPLAASLGLRAVARTVVVTPVGEETRVVVRVGHIAVGSAEAAHLEATVIPGGVLPGGAAGILGQDFLARFDYTIDYRRGRVTWGRPPVDGIRVPLRAEGGLFTVDLRQRGRAARLVPDTGSGGLVLFEGGALRTEAAGGPAEIASAGGRRTRVGTRLLRDLTLGPLALREQVAFIVPRRGDGSGDGLLPLHQFASVAFASRDGYLVITPR